MMNDKKKQDVYKILMTPIQSTRYSESKPIIKKVGSVIETTQTYWPQYIDKDTAKPFKYEFRPDCDMSDFACGFYEIIYKDILNDNKLVDDNGNFADKNFAGDTMNSFDTIANLVLEAGTKKKRTPIEKWPKWLQEYSSNYHCLANFWLIPMEIGRTLKNEWCKGSYDKNVQDYMDRFLKLYKDNSEQYKTLYPIYFKNMKSFEDFAGLHILVGSYVSENMEVKNFSNEKLDGKIIVEKIENNIMKRAKAISESKYAEELWKCFFENGLLEYKETYVESDEYPFNKEIHPYAYECPKCNRIIANDENYSIPPVCNECAIEG